MKVTIKKVLAVTLLLLGTGVAGVVSAHHSFAMFDRDTELVMEGEVVRWAFNSPHVAIYIRDSNEEVWAFEGGAPPGLVTDDPPMTGFTFQPGDAVKVVVCPLRDGRNGGAIGIVIKDDIWYTPNDGGCGPNFDAWQDWMAKGYLSKQQALDAGEVLPD
ncbi:MAG: hypothetical protein CMQ38_11095 [Gammaproteobacteria bacterium]|nr:hypothetical protein [Gammaproteobacteria bacterium]|tara:strand:- start:1077 stop:1553 length:477 start_codon:yes stop_codon:yes gene_type:complete